jgi:hypothetical protein
MTDGAAAAPAASAGDSSSAMSGGLDASAMSGGLDVGSASSFDSALDSASSIGVVGSFDSPSLTGGTSLSSDLFSSAPLSSVAPSSFGSTSFDPLNPTGTSSLTSPLGFSTPSLFDPAPLSSVTPIGFSTNPFDFSSATPGAFTGLSSTFGPPPAFDPMPVGLPPSQEFSPGDINPVTNNLVTDVTPLGEIVQEVPAGAAPVDPITADTAIDVPNTALFDPTPIAQQAVTLQAPTLSGALFDPAAMGGTVTPIADQTAAAAPQIGYGDQPLGVPVSQIGQLTDADAAAFVDERLAEYRNASDAVAKDQALDRALNAAYAWRVQGGDTAPFDRIMDAVASEPRDAIMAQVVRDRANAIVDAGIAGNIRALNNNGVNFGAQIHELQRAIAQDPDNAYGVISRAYSAMRADPGTGVGMIEMGAFRQAMSGIGYGQELQDATTNYAARLEADQIAERAALARMSPGERFSYMVGQAMDAGVPLGIGMGVAMALAPGARAPGPYNVSTAGMTAAERQAVIEYAQRSNAWLAQNGPVTVQPTAGPLRSQANAATRTERLNAERAGTPYQGQAGHVPDTALTGLPNPPAGWLDMPGRSNSVVGGGLSSRIGQGISVITVDGRVP